MNAPVIHKWEGKPIKTPGIYSGVDIAVYHTQAVCDGPSVSSTGLRALWSKSPRHFYAEWSGNPKAVPQQTTAALTLGSAVHHLFLGEDQFSTRFVQRPDAIRDEDGDMTEWHSNKKVCKAWLKEQEAAGREVLLKAQLDAIRAMAQSIKDDELIRDLLFGETECTMVARDPDTGIWLKARPDVIPVDGHYADLKTTQSVVDVDLKRTLRDYSYHMQAGLAWWVADLLKIPFTSFANVYIETKSPFCARVVEQTDADLSRGRLQSQAMVRLFARCLKSKRWPGPGNSDAEYFSLPLQEAEWIDKRLTEIEAMEKAMAAAAEADKARARR